MEVRNTEARESENQASRVEGGSEHLIRQSPTVFPWSLFSPVIAITSIVGLILTASQLWQFSRFTAVTNIARALVVEPTTLPIAADTERHATADRLIESTMAAESLAWLHPRSAFSHGRAALVKASLSDNLEAKTGYICEARDSFIHATQLAPAIAEFHIAWADVEAQIPSPQKFCPLGRLIPLANADPPGKSNPLNVSERLQLARSLAPFSSRDNYLLALVHLARGQKMQALELLRSNQELDPNFSKEQRNFVFHLVWNKEQLAAALPRKFPHVVTWVEYYRINQPGDYLRWSEVFEAALLDATNELVARLDGSSVALDAVRSYLSDIASLPISCASEKLRPKLDKLLSQLQGPSTELGRTSHSWSNVLSQRARLRRIPVAKSLIVDDRSPRSTSLFAWTTDNDTRIGSLDVVGRSLGIMIPENSRAKLLLLESNSVGGQGVSAGDIEIWLSEDNEHYFQLANPPPLTVYNVNGKQKILISLTTPISPFLKIRYVGASQRGRFAHTMQQLVQVYGDSTTADTL